MRNDRLLRIVLLGVGWLLASGLAGLLGGCVNVNADSKGWQDVAKGYSDTYAGGSSDQDRAIRAAREAAIEAGIRKDQLSEYQYSTTREEKLWWVKFHHPSMGKDSWPGWFMVRVDPDNKTLIYRVKATAPDR